LTPLFRSSPVPRFTSKFPNRTSLVCELVAAPIVRGET